jgi:hypothetical protein
LSIEFGAFDSARELPDQRKLFEVAFPESRNTPVASIEHYRWKFHSYPDMPAAYEYAAREGDDLLGYYAALPYFYEIHGRRRRTGLVCDVMTDPDVRGRGVFTGLGRFAVASLHGAGVDFLTGYPVRPEVMGGHLRAGWHVAFDLPMYLMPLKADAILHSKRLGWLARVANPAIAAVRRVQRPRPAAGYVVRTGPPEELMRSHEFDEFIAAWSATVENHLIKSREFYQWRLGAPATRYRAILVHRDQVLVAAAVGRVVDLHGVPSLALLDVMALDGDLGALAGLYRAAEAEARGSGVEAVVTMMSRHRAREYRVSRFGFLRSPFTFKLILHTGEGAVSLAQLSREEDWHLMWIDSDDL